MKAKLKRVLPFLISIFILAINVSPVYADEYTGSYDWTNPDHENHLNETGWEATNMNNSIVQTNIQKTTAYLVSQGLAKEGVAGIVGNIMCEGGMDPTSTEGHSTSWARLVSGWRSGNYLGFGIVGFTVPDIVFDVFDKAYEMGQSCLDIEPQLAVVMDWVNMLKVSEYPCLEKLWSNPNNLDTEKYIMACTAAFFIGIEKPACYSYYIDDYPGMTQAILNTTETGVLDSGPMNPTCAETIQARYEAAIALYTSTIKDFSGGSSQSQQRQTGTSQTGSILYSYAGVVDEWKAIGITSDKLSDGANSNIAFGDLEYFPLYQQYKIAEIQKSMELANKADTWDTARIVLSFIGLLMVQYAMILGICMLLDKVNIFGFFSAVNIVSLGTINYVGENSDNMANQKRFVTQSRLLVIIGVIMIVGGLLLTGAVLPKIMSLIYKGLEALNVV